MGFADRDWWVAAVMEGMDKKQKLDPLSQHRQTTLKTQIKRVRQENIFKVYLNVLNTKNMTMFQKGGRFNSWDTCGYA